MKYLNLHSPQMELNVLLQKANTELGNISFLVLSIAFRIKNLETIIQLVESIS